MKTVGYPQGPSAPHLLPAAAAALCLSLLLLDSTGSAAAAQADEAEKVLTTARSIRVLSPEQANEPHPVKLQGVVTHANPHIGDFFIYDETSPIYIHPQEEKGLTMGDRVEVEGFTSAGSFAPCVRATLVKKIGTGPLPDPLPYDLNLEDSRWLDAQWVQCWALIQRVQPWAGYTLVKLRARNGSAYLLIPGEEHVAHFQNLIGASVRVRGVCVPHFNERRVVNNPPRIFAQQLDNLVVLERAEVDPAKSSALLLEQLFGFSPDPHPGARRVKVAGVVTGTGPKATFYIQDRTAQACILPLTPVPVTPGTKVEVVGLLVVEGASLRVENATVQVLGQDQPPTPHRLSADEEVAKTHAHALVTLSGRVLEVSTLLEPTTVTLQGSSATFQALLPKKAKDLELPPGSRVDVTGILVPTDLLAPPFRLLLRDRADITIVELPPPPPWWTPARMLLALGAAALVGLAAFVWVVTLRMRIRRQTTQLRTHFEKEAQLEGQLRQSQKLEAIGRLAGGIAHDFNNLLTVINGCSDMLQVRLPREGEPHELVEAIGKAGERAAALTKQLLLFSRHRPATLAAIDLNEVLTDAETLLRRLMGEHIELVVSRGEGLPRIVADAGLIHQVLLNLAANARDAMPEQGKLLIATSAAPGDRVRLSVTDTGCGMDEATQARLFEPFFTTKEMGKGTGLGLACVYGIIQTLRGEIAVRSIPGSGTVWEIDFPAADVAAPAAPLSGSAASAYPLNESVVLVVEDEPGVRQMIQMALEGKVARLLVAGRPSQALELARGHHGPIHLLVTDVVMPEMNGRVLAEQLRRQYPHLLVLFMSGYNTDEVLRQGVQAEEVVFLQKPYKPEALLTKIAEVLQTHSFGRVGTEGGGG